MVSTVKQINALQARLSEANFEDTFKLPQMVVVGSQSSGKSSTLESIIGFEILPKGSGIVTKCPIRIQMNQTRESREYATFTHLPREEFDFSTVAGIISRRSDELTTDKSLSYEEITVSLYSPNMINLTLVDLPGITAVPTEKQPQDFVEQVKSMVRKKIENEMVLILAITAANDNVENSIGLGFAQTVDPTGARTVAIFTKLDLLTTGSLAAHVSSILYRLPLGYIGVICRSVNDIGSGMSLEKHFQRENELFHALEEYHNNSECFGIAALRNKLDKEFKKHILMALPTLRQSLNNKLRETAEELGKFTIPLPEISHLESYTHKMIDNYFQECEGILDGSLVSIEHDIDYGGVLFRNNFVEFYSKMDIVTELFNMPAEKVMKIIRNKSGVQSISEPLIRSILRSNILQLKPKLIECLNQVAATYDKFIEMIKDKELGLYRNLKRCFQRKILEVKNKNLLETEKQIEFLVELECECTDPDLVGTANIASNLRPETLLDTIIKNYFLTAKRSLKENTVKYIKHYFIRKNFSDTRLELHNFINKQSEIINLYEEAAQIEKERNMLLKRKENYEMIHYYLKEIEIDFS